MNEVVNCLVVMFVRRLLMEVDALKSAGTKPVGDKPAVTQASADHVMYQLRYRPEEAKFSSTARVCMCPLSSPRHEQTLYLVT